jgi:hypothetical protein
MFNFLKSGADKTDTAKAFPVTKTDAEWRHLLTPEQYDVLRGHGTDSRAAPAGPVSISQWQARSKPRLTASSG